MRPNIMKIKSVFEEATYQKCLAYSTTSIQNDKL